MKMSRRHLLAAAAVLTSLPGGSSAAALEEAELMLALLPSPNIAAVLGESWMEQKRRRPAEILESLGSKLPGDPLQLRHALATAVADDFRTGNVVKIDGWRIARTQAELCALAYLATTGIL